MNIRSRFEAAIKSGLFGSYPSDAGSFHRVALAIAGTQPKPYRKERDRNPELQRSRKRLRLANSSLAQFVEQVPSTAIARALHFALVAGGCATLP